MAEDAASHDALQPGAVETRPEANDTPHTDRKSDSAVENSTNPGSTEAPQEGGHASTTEIPASSVPLAEKEDKQTQPSSDQQHTTPQDQIVISQADEGMASEEKADAAPAPDASDDIATGTEASANKSSKGRRKSGGVPEHKNKKLNKKASKAKMTHTDAKPGDYFMIRLKGYPLWPGIVCDETMLPNTLLKQRPVTAARPDGTYREDYSDGGAKINDRTFAVMYLHTNEFSWIPNTDLVDMDFETVGDVTSSMRKDLAAAQVLASERHDLDFYKEILRNFMEARTAELEAKEAAKAAKKAEKAAKADKTSKPKKKSKAVVDEDEDAEGDTDMVDAPADLDSEDAEAGTSEKKKNKKKRKATDDDEDSPKVNSVKKPKTTISLKISTPKAVNRISTPKTAKDSAAKMAVPKSKKATPKAKEAPEDIAAPKEPELSPEENRLKKQKEILFLRHKLQKGLLTKDQEPKEEEMKQMSEFVNKLEGYADLEVSIIRTTKINKVLKAILKVSTIPKEGEFQFKARSQTLLDTWNKLLASEGTPVPTSAPTNGLKEEAKLEGDNSKAATASTNGIKESASEGKAEEKAPTTEAPVPETRVEDSSAPSVEEPAQEPKQEPAAIDSAA